MRPPQLHNHPSLVRPLRASVPCSHPPCLALPVESSPSLSNTHAFVPPSNTNYPPSRSGARANYPPSRKCARANYSLPRNHSANPHFHTQNAGGSFVVHPPTVASATPSSLGELKWAVLDL